MKQLLMLAAALMLSACSARTENNIYGGVIGQRVVGNDAYVTVWNVWNEMDALPLADNHCKQFSKSARFKHMEPYRAVFDCIRS